MIIRPQLDHGDIIYNLTPSRLNNGKNRKYSISGCHLPLVTCHLPLALALPLPLSLTIGKVLVVPNYLMD